MIFYRASNFGLLFAHTQPDTTAFFNFIYWKNAVWITQEAGISTKHNNEKNESTRETRRNAKRSWGEKNLLGLKRNCFAKVFDLEALSFRVSFNKNPSKSVEWIICRSQLSFIIVSSSSKQDSSLSDQIHDSFIRIHSFINLLSSRELSNNNKSVSFS